MLTVAFVCMFVAGIAVGYALKTVLARHTYEAMTEAVIDAAARPPCLVEGCACRDLPSAHLH